MNLIQTTRFEVIIIIVSDRNSPITPFVIKIAAEISCKTTIYKNVLRSFQLFIDEVNSYI